MGDSGTAWSSADLELRSLRDRVNDVTRFTTNATFSSANKAPPTYIPMNEEPEPNELADDADFPVMTCEGMLQFQYSAWYKEFEDVAVESTIIPLDAAFERYMNADGVFIPQGSEDR